MKEIDILIADALANHRMYLKKKVSRAAEELKEQLIVEPENHPDLLCIYEPEVDCDLVYSTESWDALLRCETCNKLGSYYMVNEKYKIGSCRKEIMECGNYSQIIELPEGHSYYAMDIESGKD